MPQQFLDKVKFLCKHIAKDEWSGILFYSMNGSIKSPKDLVITVEDILPMHKGNKTFTEYDIDGRYADYIMENPEVRMEWKMGHIHSHNDMEVYFSGTDWEELNDNSAAHNFYLSLIVNNYMEFKAKIGLRGMVNMPETEFPYMAQDADGVYYEVEKTNLSLKKEKLFVIDCDIEVPLEEIKTSQDFEDKVIGIINNSKQAEKEAKEKFAKIQAQKVKTNVIPLKGKANTNFKPGKKIPALEALSEIDWHNESASHISDSLTQIEIFTITMLRGTNPPDMFTQDVEEALEELEMAIDSDFTTGKNIALSILENYIALYSQQYEEKESPEEFTAITQEVIEILEDHEASYDFISYTILGLKNLLAKFEENASRNTTH